MHLSILLLCFNLFVASNDSNTLVNNEYSHVELQDTLKLEDIKVPDGFLFRNSNEVLVDINIEDGNGVKARHEIYSIYGIDHRNEKHLMTNGMTSAKGKLKMVLDVPLHYHELLITVESDLIKDHYFYLTNRKTHILHHP